MYWAHPPLIKFYEALGSLADKRLELLENGARVYSSSGNKFYSVSHDPEMGAIMANDNGSYWQGYLGYPSIAYLLAINKLPLDQALADLLLGIRWKDLNVKYKNDFLKTLAHIEKDLGPEKAKALRDYIEQLDKEVLARPVLVFGKKVRPPTGY